MLISGSWHLCDDGLTRPVIRGKVQAVDGSWNRLPFLVDTGADRTVFSADVLGSLGLVTEIASQQLGGVGGKVDTVVLEAQIKFRCEGGTEAVFRGTFSAFPSPDALDMSVLGRDVLDRFAVIVDRQRDTVCLLGQNHYYKIEQH